MSQLSWGGGGVMGQPSMHIFFVKIGPDSQESFQLLQDCNWDRVIHPNIPVGHPSTSYSFLMSRNDGNAMSLVWTIGEADYAQPGEIFQVKVLASGERPMSVTWERATGGSALEDAVTRGEVYGR